jgi:hypothetical protein
MPNDHHPLCGERYAPPGRSVNKKAEWRGSLGLWGDSGPGLVLVYPGFRLNGHGMTPRDVTLRQFTTGWGARKVSAHGTRELLRSHSGVTGMRSDLMENLDGYVCSSFVLETCSVWLVGLKLVRCAAVCLSGLWLAERSLGCLSGAHVREPGLAMLRWLQLLAAGRRVVTVR